MDLKAFGIAIAKLGLPLLGAALPIPGGMAIGTALAGYIGSPTAKPEDILATISGNADALVKAKQFELTHQETMLKLQTDYEISQRQSDSADLVAVNTTMQEEAKQSANENWWQTGWRPFNGYVVGSGSFVAVCYVCTLFYNAMTLKDAPTIATVVAMVPQLAFSVAAILGVPGAAVGITAWHRGKMQVEQAKGGE